MPLEELFSKDEYKPTPAQDTQAFLFVSVAKRLEEAHVAEALPQTRVRISDSATCHTRM